MLYLLYCPNNVRVRSGRSDISHVCLHSFLYARASFKTITFWLLKERVHHQSKLVLKCSTNCTDMTSWVHFLRGSIFWEQFPLRCLKVVLRALDLGNLLTQGPHSGILGTQSVNPGQELKVENRKMNHCVNV